MPGQHIAFCVERGLEITGNGGSIVVLLHIVFTTQHGFHRHVEFFGDEGGVIDNIPVEWQASTETTAQVAVMKSRIIFGDAGNFCHPGLDAQGILGTCPHVHLVVMNMHRAIHGFHGGVGKIGDPVIRFDHICGRLHRRLGITLFHHLAAFFVGEAAFEASINIGAGSAVVIRCLEHRGNQFQRFLGAPVAVGNHSDGIF